MTTTTTRPKADSTMMLVDSNILVYAFNRSLPDKNAQAQEFLKQNATKLAIAHQNILETIRVLTHPKFKHPVPVHEALHAVAGLTGSFRVITPSDATRHLALVLIEHHGIRGNQIFDAYLAATAITNDITTIATDNVKDFRDFEGVSAFSPFAN